MSDGDVLVSEMSLVGFQADTVIGSIDEAVLDDSVLAVDDVDAVIVPESAAVNCHSLDVEVGAAVNGEGPAGCAAYVDAFHGDVLAVDEENAVGTVSDAAELEGVLDESCRNLGKEVVRDFAAVAVDDTEAGDRYVLGVLGGDECGAQSTLS